MTPADRALTEEWIQMMLPGFEVVGEERRRSFLLVLESDTIAAVGAALQAAGDLDLSPKAKEMIARAIDDWVTAVSAARRED